jgi:hypothetical protein
MQHQHAPSPRLSHLTSSGVIDAASVFDVLLADHLTVAAAFDLLKHELDQPHPDHDVCCHLLLKIDALLGTHATTKARLLDSALSSSDADHLHEQLEALVEVDRVWSAKARGLMQQLEQRILLDESLAS